MKMIVRKKRDLEFILDLLRKGYVLHYVKFQFFYGRTSVKVWYENGKFCSFASGQNWYDREPSIHEVDILLSILWKERKYLKNGTVGCWHLCEYKDVGEFKKYVRR